MRIKERLCSMTHKSSKSTGKQTVPVAGEMFYAGMGEGEKNGNDEPKG